MKQLLLILAFLLPLCAYPQLKEPFNGPEITSDNPWTGDLDCFVIENGWLVSRADPTQKSVSIETPLVYSATMEWEFEIRMDFKPSDQNHIRLHVYLDDQRMLGLKNDYYVQIGSNKKTITFRKHTATEKNPKILIEKALDVLLGAVDLKVKLTLENHKIWNLYVLEKGRFVLIGSCESEVSSSCKGGQLRLLPKSQKNPMSPMSRWFFRGFLLSNRSPSLFSNYNIIFRWISVRRYSLYRVSVMLLV